VHTSCDPVFVALQYERFKTGVAVSKHMEHICMSDVTVSTALSKCTDQILDVSLCSIVLLYNCMCIDD